MRIKTIAAVLIFGTGLFSPALYGGAARPAVVRTESDTTATQIIETVRLASWTDGLRELSESGLDIGSPSVSLAALRLWITFKPDGAEPYRRMADLLMSFGYVKRAGDLFDTAARLAPDDWRARVGQAEVMLADGRRAEAIDRLKRVIDLFEEKIDYDETPTRNERIAAIGAFWHSEQYQRAYDAINLLVRDTPDDFEIRILAGSFCKDVSKDDEARRHFTHALKFRPYSLRAIEPLLELSLERGPQAAVGFHEMMKKTNASAPQTLIWATFLDFLQDYRLRALENIARAEKLYPWHVEIHAARAALEIAEGRDAEAEKMKSAFLNGDVSRERYYLALAATLQLRHRHEKAIEYARLAADVNPASYEARRIEATSLLRTARDTEAKVALEYCYKHKNFDYTVVNLLRLLDGIDDYTLIKKGDHTLKLHQRDRDILADYVVEELEQNMNELATLFDWRPAAGAVLEMSPSNEDFSVRSVGKPHLPALGVCFGYLVTMPSPRANMAAGRPFHWGKVLRHELGHTCTLIKTDFKISRWFTEGVSSYLEGGFRDEYDQMLLAAWKNDRLLPLERMGEGFYRQGYPGQMIVSYYHASLVVGWLVEKSGHAALVRTLDLVADGLPDHEAFAVTIGLSGAEIDAAVGEYVKRYVSQIPYEPGFMPASPEAAAAYQKSVSRESTDTEALAAHFWRALDGRNFKSAARIAARIEELDTGSTIGALGQTVEKLAEKNFDEAAKGLRAYTAHDPERFWPRYLYAVCCEKLGRTGEAVNEYTELTVRWPRALFGDFSGLEKNADTVNLVNPYLRLYALLKKRGELEGALDVLGDYARLKQTDAAVRFELGGLYLASQNLEKARYWTREAILINPYVLDYHERLADILIRMGRPEKAVLRLNAALAIAPKSVKSLALMAEAYEKTGDGEKAAEFRKKLEAENPNFIPAPTLD